MFVTISIVVIIAALIALGFYRNRVSVFSGRGNWPEWLTLPPWPNGSTDIEVRSQSRDTFHHVDLIGNTCTCEKWAETCTAFPTNDLRRICRHIAQALDRPRPQYCPKKQNRLKYRPTQLPPRLPRPFQ